MSIFFNNKIPGFFDCNHGDQGSRGRKEKVARRRDVTVAAIAISRHFKPLVYISVNSVEDLNNKSFFNLYHCDQLRPQGWEENVASRSEVAVGAVRSFETHFPVVVRLCFES